MTNRLAQSTSPYLLQHAENPVAWWPWCQDAFDEARRRGVPVLLSVGYAACHWCHVMAHESFEDESVATVMNEHFVNIKVDREERPDVDAVYMRATQAMIGQGGWPMTCFLTPDGEPFHCGTYSPPSPRHGMPSFRQLLAAVAGAWRERPDEVRDAAARLVAELGRQAGPLPEAAVDAAAVARAVSSLEQQFDAAHGGFSGAPKFPPSMLMEFLLRHHERTGSAAALTLVESTATAMARGGIYDQLAGGFARYSTDVSWTVPHFEKMLYDNALLLRAYAHLARRTGSALAHRVAIETAKFVCGGLGTVEGGFAAALDADTDGAEGLTYVWTREQLVEALGADDGAWAAQLLTVTEEGTFERGTSVPQLLADPGDQQRWKRVRARLLAVRQERAQPARDDKVVTAWNGLAITALAEAGAALGRPEWTEAAARCADFLLRVHLVDGRLRRTSRAGSAGTARGVLEDYGCFAEGLLALHQASGQPRWLAAATELLDTALARFAGAEAGSYYDTSDDAEALVNRPCDPSDNASPSGSSSLAAALLAGSALGGADRASGYRESVELALARAGLLVARAPRFAGYWLAVAEAALAGPLQVAVAGPDGAGRSALLRTAVLRAPGGSVVLAGLPDAAGVPLLADRPALDGAPAAYVCRGYVCDRPVTSTEDLVEAVSAVGEPR
ncbi:MAG: thioredoxin domain-containing protein [Sciscionella sp.]